jgi:hypothetical protein
MLPTQQTLLARQQWRLYSKHLPTIWEALQNAKQKLKILVTALKIFLFFLPALVTVHHVKLPLLEPELEGFTQH